MNESIQSLVKSKDKKRKLKPKKPVGKKSKKISGTGLEPDLVQIRAQVASSSHTQSSSQDQGYSLGSLLNDVSDYAGSMRPPPAAPIPRVPRSISGDSVSERSEVDDEFQESEEDLGRKERRRMYLSGLRDLVLE